MPTILIIGATRGLGASLAIVYASQPSTTVFGTTRSAHGPKGEKLNEKIVWVPNIDVSEEGVGKKLVNQLGMLGGGGGMNEGGVKGFDVVVSERSRGWMIMDWGETLMRGNRSLLQGILLRRILLRGHIGGIRLRCIVRGSRLPFLHLYLVNG